MGWCWALAVRDRLQKITYSVCTGCQRTVKHELEVREIPSVGLPTKRFKNGRPMKFCGPYCASKDSEYNRALEIVKSSKVLDK